MTEKHRAAIDAPLKGGRRHPLLLQIRLNEMVFWPTVLIIALITALLIWNPDKMREYRPYLTIILLGSAGVLILTFVLRLRAYVRCQPQVLRIQLPFRRLDIPYGEIQTTRPSELFRLFPLRQQSPLQRNFLGPLLGHTAIVVQLRDLPMSRVWLRLWMSKFMLCPDVEGLVLAVPDWLEFHNELGEYKARSHYARTPT
jgi:hypothetical protein